MSDPDTSFTDEPVCPHCGHEETDAWEIDFGGIDGDVVASCGSCGEDYHLSRKVTFRVTFRYASNKKENSNDRDELLAAAMEWIRGNNIGRDHPAPNSERLLAAYDALPEEKEELPWEAMYEYALVLIDAAAEDGDGMAGVAFSAQVPLLNLPDMSASQLADLMCRDQILRESRHD